MAKLKELPKGAAERVAQHIRAHLGDTLDWRTIDALTGVTSTDLQYNKVIGPLLSDHVITPASDKRHGGSDEKPIMLSYRIARELPKTLGASAGLLGAAGSPTPPPNETPATPAAPAKPSASASASPTGGATRTSRARRRPGDGGREDRQSGSGQRQDTPQEKRPGAANGGGLGALNPQITHNGYLAANPKVERAWHHELLLLSAWLDDHPIDVPPALGEERSFEVFGNEKLLNYHAPTRASANLYGLLKRLGLYAKLNIEELPVEMPHYVPASRRTVLTILVVENHVPYLRIQDAMKRGQRSFFGRHVDGVVYGEGGRATIPTVVQRTQETFGEGRAVKYLYWGDIDREGMAIYEKFARHKGVSCELLINAYKAMLDAVDRTALPKGSRGSSVPAHAGIDLAKELDPEQLETYITAMMVGLRVPQEAVAPETYCHPHASLSASVLGTTAKLPKVRMPWRRG